MSQRSQPELFNDAFLIQRLFALGLTGVSGVESHQNRAVMVSVTPRGVLRIHRGYAYAPDSVLSSIVTFVRPGVRRHRRREAEAAILAFPVDAFAVPPRPPPRRRRPKTRPEDRPLVRRLVLLHDQFNARYFDGALARLPFRVSRRMRRRLGELTLDDADRPIEIAVSGRHITRDGWREAEKTLLHEMVHQWQAESGRPVDHGAIFRRKARAVGITPRAMRDVGHSPNSHKD